MQLEEKLNFLKQNFSAMNINASSPFCCNLTKKQHGGRLAASGEGASATRSPASELQAPGASRRDSHLRCGEVLSKPGSANPSHTPISGRSLVCSGFEERQAKTWLMVTSGFSEQTRSGESERG